MRDCTRKPGACLRQLLRAAAALVAVSFCCANAFGTNGDLDPTFGAGGLALTGLTALNGEGAYGPVIQPDGKILVCEAFDAGFPDSVDAFVARFDENGTLDADFGDGGIATIDFDEGYDACRAITLQADGKIVIAGNTQQNGVGYFAIARLTRHGLPDTTFGGGTGKVTFAFDLGGDNDAGASGIAIQDDQKIVVAGYGDTTSHGADFAVARLLADGSLDTTFGAGGKATIGFDLPGSASQDDRARALALDAEQRIVLGGVARSGPSGAGGFDFAVARFLPDGQLDTSFDGDGRATVAFDIGVSADDEASALLIQPDGRIVLDGLADTSSTGTPNYDMALARLLPNGAPDPDFGTIGKTIVAFDLVAGGADVAFGLAGQANGKLLAVGYAQDDALGNALAASIRLDRDGGLDHGYGVGGRKTYNFGLTTPSLQFLRGVAVAPDGIIACGTAKIGNAATDMDDFVVRLLDDLLFADGFE